MTGRAPKKRKDCEKGFRPCPWVRCKHHILWCYTPKADATELLAKSDKEIFALLFSAGPRNIRCIARHAESCVLDVAKAPRSLDKIGGILGITKERVRQIEKRAIVKLRKPKRLEFIEDFECMTPFEDRLLN